MKYITIPTVGRPVSQVALGCMRIGRMTDAEADAYMGTALECGYNYFDHADIYGGGRCEQVFGGILRRDPSLRDKIVIQTKCSIRPGSYDFSKEHILSSVEGSLRRLGVERVDVLLLHRPDLLMEPEEVAEAFDELERSGKVGAFGLSNHNPMQIELLQKYVRQPLLIDQMQLSIPHAYMIASGANVNLQNNEGIDRDGYLRDYCRVHGITIQPWSPLQHGFIDGAFLANERYADLKDLLSEIAAGYGISETGLAIAWLLRLPDKMQPIVGSTNLGRLREIAAAADVTLTREDWYRIYTGAGYPLP